MGTDKYNSTYLKQRVPNVSDEYTKLLDSAMERIPKKASSGERFELPPIQGVRIGSRTIIQNFKEIADRMNRDPLHLLKFLSKELATAATMDGARAIFQGVFRVESINRLLDIYTQRCVICPVCKRPDTKMDRHGRYFFLVCEACGARSSMPMP
jgi:translation initiation factor 2 subunit 2